MPFLNSYGLSTTSGNTFCKTPCETDSYVLRSAREMLPAAAVLTLTVGVEKSVSSPRQNSLTN